MTRGEILQEHVIGKYVSVSKSRITGKKRKNPVVTDLSTYQVTTAVCFPQAKVMSTLKHNPTLKHFNSDDTFY